MKAYLVTKSGAVGEYELHPFKVREMVATGRYRQATGAERLSFVRNREERLRNERHPGMLDVLFVTPKPGARDGYGIVQDAMVEYFMDHGIFLNRFDRGQKVVFVYHYPYYAEPYLDRDVVLYTMFETTRFPEDWGAIMKQAKVLTFPAKFCMEIAKKQFGLDSRALPHGINTDNFRFIHRKRTPKDTFTFLHYDAFKYRKGWDILLNAFESEFQGNENVRLVLKTTRDAAPYPLGEYKKVTVIKGKLTDYEMRQILADADCFVFPTRGEGFGMTPLEAMATGMPAIVPDTFGIREYFDPAYCLGLDIVHEVAKYDSPAFDKMDLGFFKTPTQDSLRKAMRDAYHAWKNGEWITQFEEESRACSEYARQFSLRQFSESMSQVIKTQCAESGVSPEPWYT